MNAVKSLVAGLLIGTAMFSVSASSSAAEEITVAYLLKWPMPNLYAKANKIYEKELGVTVNWLAVDAGTEMSQEMASGNVQIGYSQGVPPFVVAASAGQNLQIADVAVSYSDNDNCVVRSKLKISKDNAKKLEGKEVGVPIGTAAHYGFLRQMDHFGVDVSTMKMVDLSPQNGAAEFADGKLDMVCGWGGALSEMKKHGNVLLTGQEKEDLEIRVFDVTTVSEHWAEDNAELLSKFLKVTADMNEKFAAGGAEEMIPVIAQEAKMDLEATRETLAGFTYLSIEEQLGPKWLGGGAQKFLKQVADFFVNQDIIPSARDGYEGAVDPSYLEAASKM